MLRGLSPGAGRRAEPEAAARRRAEGWELWLGRWGCCRLPRSAPFDAPLARIAVAMSSVSSIQIPSRLPLLLTHEGVLLPGSTMRTSVDSARNLQLVRSRLLKGTSLQSTILGVIPNTPDPASDAQDLPPLHR